MFLSNTIFSEKFVLWATKSFFCRYSQHSQDIFLPNLNHWWTFYLQNKGICKQNIYCNWGIFANRGTGKAQWNVSHSAFYPSGATHVHRTTAVSWTGFVMLPQTKIWCVTSRGQYTALDQSCVSAIRNQTRKAETSERGSWAGDQLLWSHLFPLGD